jgi:hypothetical protein
VPDVDEEAAGDSNSDSELKSAGEPRGGRQQGSREHLTPHGIGRSFIIMIVAPDPSRHRAVLHHNDCGV